jgi:hypothetical protein
VSTSVTPPEGEPTSSSVTQPQLAAVESDTSAIPKDSVRACHTPRRREARRS